jgi:multisubunit Na+/H+ antiporter MnhG subunit
MLILSKILITISVVGLLRCSQSFKRLSRRTDEQAFAALQRIMHATEDYGYPPQLVPLLILLTALTFMLSIYVTTPGGR